MVYVFAVTMLKTISCAGESLACFTLFLSMHMLPMSVFTPLPIYWLNGLRSLRAGSTARQVDQVPRQSHSL